MTLLSSPPTNVNYDFIDIADGTGYVVYYGSKGNSGSNLLTPQIITSEETVSFLETETITSTFVKKFDIDFDVTFNVPKDIKGKVYCNIPIGVSAPAGATRKPIYFAAVGVKHVDVDGNETILASGATRHVNESGGIPAASRGHTSMVGLAICDVSGAEHFKKDETLRMTVEGWFSSTNASESAHLMIGHDPSNQEFVKGNRAAYNEAEVNQLIEFKNVDTTGKISGATSTQMQFQVPFVLDI